MKNLLTATLPALALLALGGCAASGALTTSTENDGVYYSSADKTTANGSLNSVYNNRTTAGSPNPDGYAYSTPPTTAPAATSDDANPDYYQGSTTQAANSGILGANSDYYSNNYGTYSSSGSGFGVPYTGPGVSSFNYAPAYAAASPYYGSPYGYGSALSFGYGYGGYGYSPYAYSPFYDPFYSPWGYGYGSGLSLSFGYGYPAFGYGYPAFGFGYGYPYYGYGYGGYGYGYSRYGYGDPYGYGYYNRPVIYANGTRSGAGNNPILVGPRPGRGGAVLNNGGGLVNPSNPIEIGRRNTGTNVTNGLVAPAGGQPLDGQLGARTGRSATNFGGGQSVAQPATGGTNGGFAGAGQPAGMPQPAGRRGFFGGFFGNGAAQPGSAVTNNGSMSEANQQSQSLSRRSYSQPQFSERGNAVAQPQRSFEQRSFSQPAQPQQRSFEQRSFSQPSRSFGGGSGSGGSFGGGGRRGGR